MKKYCFIISLYIIGIGLNSFAQEKNESLKIIWPKEYKWKIGSNLEKDNVRMMELIPEDESLEKWSIIAMTKSTKGIKNSLMDTLMQGVFSRAQLASDNAKLTLLEKDESSTHPWVLFKIEATNFKDNKKPESQLFYMVQGESALYSSFVAVKEKTLKDDFIEKWTKVFKTSELVYK